jgi:hypothetical protein
VCVGASGMEPLDPLSIFPHVLRQATQQIGDLYFQLPVAGQEDPIYRERVYCYELYHQIRVLWPSDSQYYLCGEVDKAGHPLIRGDSLDNTKPDLLIHIPGERDNALVIEIKPVNAQTAGIEKDLKTLTAYRRDALYRAAVLLVYGSSENGCERVQRIAAECATADRGEIDLDLIQLWYHQEPSAPAEEKPWAVD